MRRITLRLAALAALLLAGRAAAQTDPPRDTIVIGAEPADTLVVSEDSAPPRPSRWGSPFAVESNGRPTPRRVSGEIAWFHPDSVPSEPEADTLAADSLPADTLIVDTIRPPRTAPADSTRPTRRAPVLIIDTARADSIRRARRAAAGDTTRARRPAAGDTTRARRAAAGDTTRARRPAGDTTRARRVATGDTTRAARRDTAAAPRPATGRPRTHTVAAGETLFGIARRYGVTTAQIRALNPDIDSQSLEVGTVLRLPAGARAPGTPAPASTPAPAAPRPRPAPTRPGARRTHTVAPGETLFGIARRYGVTRLAIQRANGMETDQLRIGQTLVIP